MEGGLQRRRTLARACRPDRRHAHLLFGLIQSGLTTGVASFIASVHWHPFRIAFGHWLASWPVSWLIMVPVVLVAAPIIRRLVTALTGESP